MKCALNCGKEFCVIYESHHEEQPTIICKKCLERTCNAMDRAREVVNEYSRDITVKALGNRCVK